MESHIWLGAEVLPVSLGEEALPVTYTSTSL